MTPKQFDHAAEECTKALEEFANLVKKDGRSKDALGYLKEIVALAKSAIPSGQVAEDEAHLRGVIETHEGDLGPDPESHATLSSLASKAQSADTYRGMWETATRELGETSSSLELVRREREEHRQQMLSEGGKFLAEMQRADRLQDTVNRLSAAGQVLSGHVGWSMRDEFAKAAMQGLRAHLGPDSMPETVAKIAYADADAMLKARAA